MTDLFGNNEPVAIEIDEWWFNGRIIQKQSHPLLSKYISFADDDTSGVVTHPTKQEAIEYCQNNPCMKPERFPHHYLGGDGISWEYFFGGSSNWGKRFDRYYKAEVNGIRVERHDSNGRGGKRYCIGNMDKAKQIYKSEAELLKAVRNEKKQAKGLPDR